MKKFEIIKNKKIFFLIPLIVMVAGIIGYFTIGFNYDIDFTGGTTFTIDTHKSLDRAELDKIGAAVKTVIGETPSSMQKSGDTIVIFKTKDLDTDQRNAVFNKLKTDYSLADTDKLSVNNVDPVVGKDLRGKAILSILIASLLMLIYIGFRFEFLIGLSCVVSLIHDVLIMLCFTVFFRTPINLTFIAAILTILGYSINGSIVMFDRVRENRHLAKKKETLEELSEKSIWQTMNREINTTATTLITVFVLYLLGVQSIKDFMLPLLVGIIAGFYSDVFISAPLWITFKKWGLDTKK